MLAGIFRRLILNKLIIKLMVAFVAMLFAYLNLDKSWVTLPDQKKFEVTIEKGIISSSERKAFGEPDVYTYQVSNVGSQPISIKVVANVKEGDIKFNKVRVIKTYSTVRSELDVKYEHKQVYSNQSEVLVGGIRPGLAAILSFTLSSIPKLHSPTVTFSYKLNPKESIVHNGISPVLMLVRRLFLVFCIAFIPVAIFSEISQYVFSRIMEH